MEDTYIDDYSQAAANDGYGVGTSGALDVLDRLAKVGLGVAQVFMPQQQQLNQEVQRQRAAQQAATGSNKLLWIAGAAGLALVLILFLRK